MDGCFADKCDHDQGSIPVKGEPEGTPQKGDEDHHGREHVGPHVPGIGHQAGRTGFMALLECIAGEQPGNQYRYAGPACGQRNV